MASIELIGRIRTRLQQADRLYGDALRSMSDKTVSDAMLGERQCVRALLKELAEADHKQM